MSAESVLAYASLADLLTDVDRDIWADLPEPQRIAVDRVLLQEQTADGVTDQRAGDSRVSLDRLSDYGPLLLATYDLQWVEATLARVYRKLGTRSRAELGRHVNTIRE